MAEDNLNRKNRRENIRVNLVIDFCVTSIPYVESSENREGNFCFSSKTVDISFGGACIVHDGMLKTGDKVEVRTKNVLTRAQCLKCEHVYFMGTQHELQPISAVVVWANGRRAGIKFDSLSVRNENILSKLIWDNHIKSVRDEKDKNTRSGVR